jgi:hypothetical protein
VPEGAAGGDNAPVEEHEWGELNRAHWDELVPVHLHGAFHDVPGFLAGRSTLRPFELSELGPVAGLTLVHAQWHFGLDTLSWAREGATVTGFDVYDAVDALVLVVDQRHVLHLDGARHAHLQS